MEIMLETTHSSTSRRRRSPPIYHAAADPALATDQQLIVQVQHENEAALETLYDRYSARGMWLAFRILQDRDLAEGITLEAFWRVWRFAFTFQSAHGTFSDWFLGIVRRLATDELHQRGTSLLPQTIDQLGIIGVALGS